MQGSIYVNNPDWAAVVDDHPLVAHGIADFLVTHCGFDRAQPVSAVAEFWPLLDSAAPPALAVVDFWLPDGVSLPLLAQIKQRRPALKVLAISADDDRAIAEKVAAAGADGFIHKQAAPNVFAEAVTAIMAGEAWFQGQPAAVLASMRELPVTAAELGLTPRQGQVLAMMLKGLPNKRIALNLSLSEHTVKEHVTGILERLGAKNRIEVITKLRGRSLEY
ncbi:response regulator transcription factor [Methylomonas koyamae]|uniref:DNA-binding response regulator n=1 Tax=Methylomonas koyamae TaxID=702114 RepID=A0AA91DC66_9GAMM|nr:response regulator transcription factor [Methylomonas koyamae]OAI25420.1 DNA-binding response regulator [Methylomonas koyamae]